MGLRNSTRRMIFVATAGVVLAALVWWACVRPDLFESASPASAVERSAASRIITLAPNSAEIICALGAGDRVVGVSKFCVYPPELSGKARVGGLFDPNLERIAGLQPDLVVLRGGNPEVEQLCKERGVAVFHDPTERLADIEDCIRDLADLVGAVENGAELIRRHNDRIEMIRQRVTGLPKPRVFVTVSRNPAELSNILTTGRSTFLGEMIELAGGVNVFGDIDIDYPQVTPEEILTRRPDIIIELMPETKLTDSMRDRVIRQWVELGSMPAVERQRIHFITESNALIPSPRYVEIMDRVSHILHPPASSHP